MGGGVVGLKREGGVQGGGWWVGGGVTCRDAVISEMYIGWGRGGANTGWLCSARWSLGGEVGEEGLRVLNGRVVGWGGGRMGKDMARLGRAGR